MLTKNWNGIILSLVLSITSEKALATVTHVTEGLALGQIIIIIIIIDYGGGTSSLERSCECIDKQSWTADKGWFSSMLVGLRLILC